MQTGFLNYKNCADLQCYRKTVGMYLRDIINAKWCSRQLHYIIRAPRWHSAPSSPTSNTYSWCRSLSLLSCNSIGVFSFHWLLCMWVIRLEAVGVFLSCKKVKAIKLQGYVRGYVSSLPKDMAECNTLLKSSKYEYWSACSI